jgi:hypothetical protein
MQGSIGGLRTDPVGVVPAVAPTVGPTALITTREYDLGLSGKDRRRNRNHVTKSNPCLRVVSRDQ